MDEHKLADLFRDVVRDAPPSSFDAQDVLGASRQATARYRMRLATGSALGVLVLAGATVLGTNLLGPTAEQGATIAAQNSSGDRATERGAPAVPLTGPHNPLPSGLVLPSKPTGSPPESFPESTSKQGDGGSGNAGRPTGSTPTGCGPADRELAVALARELPAAAGVQPEPASRSCQPGSRAMAVLVWDGTVSGVVSVILGPHDAKSDQNGEPGVLDLPNGACGFSTYASSGRPLTVVSEPERGANKSPFSSKIEEMAKRIAQGF